MIKHIILNMSRIFSILTLLAFFLWIIPLGVFIKASQEGKFCGGQRAICLCSVNFQTKQAKNLKPMLANAGQVSKESNSSGGSNREFFTAKFFLNTSYIQQTFCLLDFYPTAALFIKSIEHVPKA